MIEIIAIVVDVIKLDLFVCSVHHCFVSAYC